MDDESGAAGAGWDEEIADSREDSDEPLQTSRRPEALPRSLSPAEGQM
jgi:hypothetical protein